MLGNSNLMNLSRRSARELLLEGTWDATGLLLEAGAAIEQRSGALPYLADFPA